MLLGVVRAAAIAAPVRHATAVDPVAVLRTD